MLAGQRGVGRPAIFLPLGAVGREVIEVSQIRAAGQLLERIHCGIGAGEAAPLLQIGVHDHIGEQIGRGLLRGDAGDQHILEAVVGEGGGVGLLSLTLADIHVPMDQGVIAKPDVAHGQLAVLQVFAVEQLHPLASLAADGQAADTRAVLSEIVAVAVPLGEDGYGFQLVGDHDRLRLAETGLAPGHGGGQRWLPAAVVKAGSVPSRQLQPAS